MFEFVFKIWFLIAILPFVMAKEGYAKLKKWIKKSPERQRLVHMYWPHVLLLLLLLILAILVASGYPIR